MRKTTSKQVNRHTSSNLAYLFTCLLISLLAASCRSPQVTENINVQVVADGATRVVTLQAGSTVAQALQAANVIPEKLDRSEPPFYVVLENGDTIKLTRVREVFETAQETIPFERQIVRNETLPEGETRLVQAGINGLQEITYRKIFEDDVEISKSAVKTTRLSEAYPEIVMVGARSSLTPVNISGALVYLAGGSAWIMEGSTANRRVLVNTGDLDGRVFKLSPKGNYLVFTRKSKKPANEEINTLWAVSTTSANPQPVWMQASNVVHFAEWIPETSSVAYSTVEPRSAAPGWQANNDLHRVSIVGGEPRKMLDAGSGGTYGWWGTTFSFSPNGRLAYARPDQIGLVDQDGGYLKPLLSITPFNSHSDWAWIPPFTWGPDGDTLYYVSHAPAPAPVPNEESPFFNLSVLSFNNNAHVAMVNLTGMFSYLAASPSRWNGRERFYQIAYLQSIFTEQSETSRYRLMVMDRDGSNRRLLFPPADATGIEPQTPVWAPDPIEGQVGDFVAAVYQGNLWLIDSGSGRTYQVTGDGLIGAIDWK